MIFIKTNHQKRKCIDETEQVSITAATGSETIRAILANGQQDIRAFVHQEDERSEQLRKHEVEVVNDDLLDFNMAWLLYFSSMIRQGNIYASYGYDKVALIATEDQCRVISN